MDYQKFIQELPTLYENWGQKSIHPKSEHFQEILDRVRGSTTTNIMQLLNFAVECMETDEIYGQIGCLPVEIAIAALLDRPDRMACVVGNFSQFDPSGETQEKFIDRLSDFNLEEQVIFCDRQVEEFFFDLRETLPASKIGVYFYDGSHDYRSQMLALLMAKNFLAERALMIINGSQWSSVQQAIGDFLAANCQAELWLDLPNWSNGIYILSWDVEREITYNWSDFQADFRNEIFIQANEQFNLEFEENKLKNVESIYKEGLSLQHLGRFNEAEAKYKEVLQWDKNHANAWHNLGMLYYMNKQYQDALAMLGKSLSIDPYPAQYHYSFGLVLEKIGNLGEAIRAYEQAIDRDPQSIDAYNNLGNIWLQAGNLERAEAIYRHAIAANPNHFGSYLNLGNILKAKNQLDEAIQNYEKSLQLKPRDPDILSNLGLAFEAKQDPIQAAEYFGYAAYRQGKYAEAIAHYQKFSSERIGDINFYIALAECYKELHQPESAIATYEEGIKHHPDSSSLYFMLIINLQDFGLTEEAIKVATKAAELLPNDLALKLEKQRLMPILYESTEEIDYYRSRFTQHLENLIQQTRLDASETLDKAVRALGLRTNFYLQYQGKNDLELQKKYGQFVYQVMGAKYPQWIQPLLMPPVNESGKIRIGYISRCMYSHTVGLLTIGWLKNHDPQKYEIYCYYDGQKRDAITQQFWLYSHSFHHIPNDLEAICQQVIADNLHVLVILDIGMIPEYTQIAGLRLAPIQCTTWGHPITSGLPTIDYFLSSELMEPENGQEHYSEQLICLPNIGISYSKPVPPENPKTRAEFHIPENAIVYLSCQSLYKYLPQYDYIFAAIARRVPTAKFAFISSHLSNALTEKFRQRLKRAFAQVGLDSEEYCLLLPRLKSHEYKSLNLVSDIFLDTLAWSGGNTTLEAVAFNLPVVTCPGEFMRGRHSYAIVKMLGVTETIAANESEYIEIAVRLGLDPEWRQSIVQKTIENNSRVFEDKTCVRALEEFYDRVVRENQPK